MSCVYFWLSKSVICITIRTLSEKLQYSKRLEKQNCNETVDHNKKGLMVSRSRESKKDKQYTSQAKMTKGQTMNYNPIHRLYNANPYKTRSKPRCSRKEIHSFRVDSFQLFNWFQLFYSIFFSKVAGHGQNRSKMTILKGGVDGSSYFIF